MSRFSVHECGQVGAALAAGLAAEGEAVRTVSRHRPPALAEGVGWRVPDASNPEAGTDAGKGASVVCQCLNATGHDGSMAQAWLEPSDGRVVARAAVFVRSDNRTHGDVLLACGSCELADGFLLVGSAGLTSVLGVWTADYVADPRGQVDA